MRIHACLSTYLVVTCYSRSTRRSSLAGRTFWKPSEAQQLRIEEVGFRCCDAATIAQSSIGWMCGVPSCCVPCLSLALLFSKIRALSYIFAVFYFLDVDAIVAVHSRAVKEHCLLDLLLVSFTLYSCLDASIDLCAPYSNNVYNVSRWIERGRVQGERECRTVGKKF